MDHFVLGTAGHIDHGKTALVKTLTGIDADRLKEEKVRGITIELGFAHMETEGMSLSFVDVPGHEKFVRSMASGAAGMDAVMLVIAADEGVMPQTREHLAICNLLGLTQGIVAVTKTDLVDPEWLNMVEEIIRESTEGTFLEGCPIIPCSSESTAGIDDLKKAISNLAQNIKKRPPSGPARLPIDRVFTMKGFGTVVTGTLVSGTLRTGDEIEALPSGVKTKIRGLQVHGLERDTVTAGTRLAVNLKGIEKRDLSRGEVLVHPSLFTPTKKLDVMVSHLNWNKKPMKRRKPFTVLYGSSVSEAVAVPLEEKEIAPGETAPAQIHLKDPLVVFPGDRFIIQGFGVNPQHGTTTGGGVILRPHPRRKRKPDELYAEWLRQISKASVDERILLEARELGGHGVSPQMLNTLLPWVPDCIKESFDTLVEKQKLIVFDPEAELAVHPKTLADLEQRTLAELKNLTKASPLLGSYPKQELFTKMPSYLSPKLFGLILERLEASNVIVYSEETAALADDPYKENRNKLSERVAEHYKEHGLTPPKPAEASEKLSIKGDDLRDILTGLVRKGVMMRARDDIYFHKAPIGDIKKKLVDFLMERKEITPLEFKEMCGVTRRFLIPLAEMLDEQHVTIRTGDVRRLRNA